MGADHQDPSRSVYIYLLRQLRRHLGYTQRQVAERMGVSRGHVSRFEGERANPTLSTVKAYLEQGLGIQEEESIFVLARIAVEYGTRGESTTPPPDEDPEVAAARNLAELMKKPWRTPVSS